MAKNKTPQGVIVLDTQNDACRLRIVKDEYGDYTIFNHIGENILGGYVFISESAFEEIKKVNIKNT